MLVVLSDIIFLVAPSVCVYDYFYDYFTLITVLIVPPQGLLKCLFPWIEREAAALAIRAQEPRSRDIALQQFLNMLSWLRTVILQDATILYSHHPSAPIFSYSPFNTKAFRQFAALSISAISHAESAAQQAYENMPEHLVAGLRGTYSDLRLEQQLQQQENKRKLEEIQEQYMKVTSALNELTASGSGPRKKRSQGMSSSFYVS